MRHTDIGDIVRQRQSYQPKHLPNPARPQFPTVIEDEHPKSARVTRKHAKPVPIYNIPNAYCSV